MDVPVEFWGEAVKTAVYVLNRSPTRSLDGVTPFEAWHRRVAHVKKVGPGVSKLSDRSAPMLFIGYEEGTKGYIVSMIQWPRSCK
jgi:hypothetical protein